MVLTLLDDFAHSLDQYDVGDRQRPLMNKAGKLSSILAAAELRNNKETLLSLALPATSKLASVCLKDTRSAIWEPNGSITFDAIYFLQILSLGCKPFYSEL